MSPRMVVRTSLRNTWYNSRNDLDLILMAEKFVHMEMNSLKAISKVWIVS